SVVVGIRRSQRVSKDGGDLGVCGHSSRRVAPTGATLLRMRPEWAATLRDWRTQTRAASRRDCHSKRYVNPLSPAGRGSRPERAAMSESDTSAPLSQTEETLRRIARERILVLDGAMGTMIQELKLDEEGYRGARFDAWNREVRGNNDLLILTRPD